VLALTLWGGQKVKERQIKIYGFDRVSIEDGVISSEDLESRIVTLPDCFFIQAYECYSGTTLADGDFIAGIIKVVLPKDEDDAKKEFMEGLKLGDDTYKGWISTTGGMKTESKQGKCETIFVREDIYEFTKEFENLISLGKFDEIEKNGEKVCINKDILSRISLGLTAAQSVGDMPDIIVLPQAKFHLIKDYKTVKKEKVKETDEEGNTTSKTIYKLEDCPVDEDIDVFDGGGIATPDVFNQIMKGLGLNYPVEFAIIRGYGIGIKGMVTKFDIIGYLDEFYKENTEFCKKEDGKYYLKDYWNRWRKVTKFTMILNESMVKLAKYYDSEENWYTYLNRVKMVDEKYAPIMGKLYISKVNKNPKDVSEYRRLNYQLLTALALSKQDYVQLMKEDMHAYRKIIKPFDKAAEKDEWITNIDYIRLFFKNIVSGESEEELEEDIKTVSENVVTKCEELLNISENFIKLKYVKKQLAKLIEKRCRDLACGKITVKARYQYIGICPISYMNYAMTRTQGEYGLQTGLFYNYDVPDGETRTIARNPLCAYSEVHNVRFVKNDLLDRYLSHCKEIIYFNQQSDILALMSSADTDGDACTVIDNDIIKAAVVIPADGKYFWNKDDGHKVTMPYSMENKFIATYRASGNLIGRIALKSASVNSNSQLCPPYYDVEAKKFVYTRDIENEDKEERIKIRDEKLKSGVWVNSYKVPEEHKLFMRERFMENETDIYTVLYNAMVSIDAPKTLYFPDQDDMEPIDEKYKKQTYFLQYKVPEEDVVPKIYTGKVGLLDMASEYIEEYLLEPIKENRSSFEGNEGLLMQMLINGDYDPDKFDICKSEIEALYKNYTEIREKIAKEKRKKIRNEMRNKEELIDNCIWDKYDEWDYQLNIKKIQDTAYQKYKETDKEYIVKAEEIMGKYTLSTVANAIGTLKNCTEDFILNLFIPVLEVMNRQSKKERFVFQKVDIDSDKEEDSITYLYEHYKRVTVTPDNNASIVANLQREEKKRLQVTKLNHEFRARILGDGTLELLEKKFADKKYILCGVEADNGQVFLTYENQRILEVFKDWYQIGKYSLLKAKDIRIDGIVNVATTGQSLKMVTTSITVEE
jgi:hypothetical protein